MTEPILLHDLNPRELNNLMSSWDEPRFRADQLWRWMYRSYAADFEAMANLPLGLRTRLASEATVAPLVPKAEQVSVTGDTRKVLFRLHDGTTIESVLMQYHSRRTACISTQAGCGMGCTFCATGQGGLARSLSAGEVVGQVLYFAREVRQSAIERAKVESRQAVIPVHPVTHVVLMGMGEPLANYEATWKAIETLTHAEGYSLGARRITVSTVGLVPGIQRLAEDSLPVNLAVSLHAPNDELRSQLVPINHRYPLADLMAAVQRYCDATRRRVTFEYALIAGLNDAPRKAQDLARLLKGVLCHVNLIPLNPTPGSHLMPSPRSKVLAFRDLLESAGIPTTVRIRRGAEIEAGCGQLRQQTVDIAL
jgi:23S rRNA (adenine2503-C2)-methyltransferase